MGGTTLFRCCLPCRGGSSQAPAANHHHLEKQLESIASTPTSTIQTPTGTCTSLIANSLTSSLIDTVVTTTLIGIPTASFTATPTSSLVLLPTSATPLLADNLIAYDLLTSTTQSSEYLIPHSSVSSQPSVALSSISSSRLSQSHSSNRTLPHIDEDDEDGDTFNHNSLRSISLIDKKVQNDNLIQLNSNNNFTNNSNSFNDIITLTPSPKIKVNRIKFTQQPQQQLLQQPLLLTSSLSSSTSSDSESSVATIHQQHNISSSSGGGASDIISPNKMTEAESGSIAELQKYHNKYLKNRRHTLANVR